MASSRLAAMAPRTALLFTRHARVTGVTRPLARVAVPRLAARLNGGTPATLAPPRGVHHVEGFTKRHVGPQPEEVAEMLKAIGETDLDSFIAKVVPDKIKIKKKIDVGDGITETELLAYLKDMMGNNKLLRSHIGMGYYNTVVPTVILRNVLESPAWYTPYTPYQPEISQGRLESLLNFQTGVADLTGMETANASLLDEATAAAEAMSMAFAIGRQKRKTFWVTDASHPQTLALLRTRAQGFGIKIELMSDDAMLKALEDKAAAKDLAGVMLQYPDTTGSVRDLSKITDAVHAAGGLVTVASDLLSLALLKPPGEWGADIVFGSAQRFGVPMGYGGPHAAFFATHGKYRRNLPGRIIGVSRDSSGKAALRLTLQTREQHIRRDKATSNVCTAQALLANISAFYMLFHGPEGIKHIAKRTHAVATAFGAAAGDIAGVEVVSPDYFDTVHLRLQSAAAVDAAMAQAVERGFNLRKLESASSSNEITVSFDETSTIEHAQEVIEAIAAGMGATATKVDPSKGSEEVNPAVARESDILTHPIFSKYTCETDLLRYIYHLQSKDLGLQHAMMPLGSCTMKLNATTEMIPVTWAEVGALHPFCPTDQAQGYAKLFAELEQQLASITGFAKVSLQPNSGAQGEYAGLRAIAEYHAHNAKTSGGAQRNVCLIPMSAHGTNPASAVMSGMKVVPVVCDDDGNIDVPDLTAKAEKHKDTLAALMITYPSTHGVFEETVVEICDTIHKNGGMVYMDGANLNAQVGLCTPGEMGADVCHLNLHKTFCIPHGGGGPGMGPIGVVEALAPFLPSHPVIDNGATGTSTVSAAPWGSSSILPISWAFIKMMGSEGLTYSTKIAILNANYLKEKLKNDFKVLFTGKGGLVAHEFIIDARPFKSNEGISETDIAKRLLDYSFHAPTMSWPVAGTLMIEPTESEPKAELDRFVDAMKAIRQEIRDVESGATGKDNNPLKHAPHSMEAVVGNIWDRSYSREQAAYPLTSLRRSKFWPTVGRLDDVYGDRNPVCSCPSMDEYQ